MIIFGVSNGMKDRQKDSLATIGAYTGGTMANTLIAGGAGITLLPALQKYGNISEDKVTLLHNAAEKALDISGMKERGVNFEYLKKPRTPKSSLQAIRLNPIEQVRHGFNAAFIPKYKFLGSNGNKIVMPEKDMAFAAFHEIGHAINFHKSVFWKSMQKFRMPCMVLASIPIFYGAVSKKSEPSEGNKLTKKQKLNNFIRDNAGKISFAAMIPILAEEAKASLRGQKLANKLLDPKMAKHVLKGNILAYSGYLCGAAAVGIGAYTAVKIKDKLSK